MDLCRQFQQDRLAYSQSEACEALGISRPTLYRLVKKGTITPAYVGRKPLFPRDELVRFLSELPHASSADLSTAVSQ